MATIKIEKQYLGHNVFVASAEAALKSWANRYPDIRYDFDGNEVFIDYEYYTLDSEVQDYLYDINDQVNEVPLPEVDFDEKELLLIEAKDIESNKELTESDDDWQHNGRISFVQE